MMSRTWFAPRAIAPPDYKLALGVRLGLWHDRKFCGNCQYGFICSSVEAPTSGVDTSKFFLRDATREGFRSTRNTTVLPRDNCCLGQRSARWRNLWQPRLVRGACIAHH